MNAGSWMVNRKYLYGGVEAGAYPEFMISGQYWDGEESWR